MPYGTARPSLGSIKSCTLTASGDPLGRHSRPLFLKFLTSSFFLVSTEMTGSSAATNGMRLAAVGGRNRRGEEIFQLEDATAGRHVFVGGHARDRGFMHADGVGDDLEIERPQVLHALGEEGVLLAHDLAPHFENGFRPLDAFFAKGVQ